MYKHSVGNIQHILTNAVALSTLSLIYLDSDTRYEMPVYLVDEALQ